MRRRDFLKTLAVGLAACGLPVVATAAAEQPGIPQLDWAPNSAARGRAWVQVLREAFFERRRRLNGRLKLVSCWIPGDAFVDIVAANGALTAFAPVIILQIDDVHVFPSKAGDRWDNKRGCFIVDLVLLSREPQTANWVEHYAISVEDLAREAGPAAPSSTRPRAAIAHPGATT